MKTELGAPALSKEVGPLFRSFDPTINPTSYFPRLEDLAADNTNQRKSCTALSATFDQAAANCWAQYLTPVGETQPIPAFRATVRDNRAGGGVAVWLGVVRARDRSSRVGKVSYVDVRVPHSTHIIKYSSDGRPCSGCPCRTTPKVAEMLSTSSKPID